MANAPKSPKKTPVKPKPAAKTPRETVEDAVVIEEIPAKTSPDDADKAGQTPKVERPAETETAAQKAPVDPEPAAPDRTKAETPPDPAPPRAKKPSRGAGAFTALVLGGIVAAAIGFAAARYVVPEGWPFPGTQPVEDPLPGLVQAQGSEIAALSDRLATLEADRSVQEALGGLKGNLADQSEAVQSQFADMVSRLDEIEARLAAVEKMAPEGSAAAQTAADAYQRELAALREMFAGELAKVEAAQADAASLKADAAVAAQAAAGRAALAQITAALDTGQPFTAALADITAATGAEPPEALAGVAANGVPTLADLQDAFPQAARAALDAAIRAAVEDGSMSRTEAFLRTQLGTRSLEPREGDDPDAILSRAEAALKQGDITGALDDLEAMPAAAAPALAGWKTMAETRNMALKAGAALAQQLNAN